MAHLEGKPAPDFNLVGSDGKTHSLKDFAGKTVVLYFYPEGQHAGCTKEACAFGELYPACSSKEWCCAASARTASPPTTSSSPNSSSPSSCSAIRTAA